jgi:hypothetical protein
MPGLDRKSLYAGRLPGLVGFADLPATGNGILQIDLVRAEHVEELVVITCDPRKCTLTPPVSLISISRLEIILISSTGARTMAPSRALR